LVAIERENELKLDGAAWEITGQPIGDDGLAVLLSGREWFDGVLILLFGLNHPFLDRAQAFDRFALVSHHRALSEALRQCLRLAPVGRSDISSDRGWKIGWHTCFSVCFCFRRDTKFK